MGKSNRFGPRRAAARSRVGMTMLEIAIAVTVLSVGLGSAVYSLLTATALERATRERAVALQTAESVLEGMQATPFWEVFERYNADPVDDPVDGASPGDDFAVQGLTAWPGDPDGMPGEIVFPGDNFNLIEDVVMPELGMPRDLTVDDPPDISGAVDPLDVRVLPVLVRVRWSGAGGDRELVLGTTLNNERKLP